MMNILLMTFKPVQHSFTHPCHSFIHHHPFNLLTHSSYAINSPPPMSFIHSFIHPPIQSPHSLVKRNQFTTTHSRPLTESGLENVQGVISSTRLTGVCRTLAITEMLRKREAGDVGWNVQGTVALLAVFHSCIGEA